MMAVTIEDIRLEALRLRAHLLSMNLKTICDVCDYVGDTRCDPEFVLSFSGSSVEVGLDRGALLEVLTAPPSIRLYDSDRDQMLTVSLDGVRVLQGALEWGEEILSYGKVIREGVLS